MASSAHHLFLFAMASVAVAGVDAWGDRLFFSKTTLPVETVDQPGKAAASSAAAAAVVMEAGGVPNGVPAFSRPSSGSTRGYGLYGRPEEKYPPEYFRRGVHRNAEKLTTTNVNVPTVLDGETVPSEAAAGGGGERAEPSYPENGSGRGRPLPYPEDGSGRGRPRPYAASSGTGGMEQPASYIDDNGSGGGRRPVPYADNGSGRGRPRPYAETSDSGGMELPAPYPGDSSSGGGRRPVPYADNGSGRGRPRPTFAGISDIGDEQPAASFAESSGSDRGRPMSMSYAGMRGQQQRQRYGMSDTRLYQNGRYYYDVGTGKYGYGHESNPVGTLPADEEFAGSGYGRAGGEARPGRRYGYGGNAAGFERENGSYDGVAENGDGFQENQKNEQYIP